MSSLQLAVQTPKAPEGPGDPIWEAYVTKGTNSAIEHGLHPLQNWVFAPYIFSVVEPRLAPPGALGLALDWGNSLDVFALLGNVQAVDDVKEDAAHRLHLKLDGFVQNGSITNAIMGCWNFLIKAIEKQLQAGASSSTILAALRGILLAKSAGSVPLLQVAAGMCGCAVIYHWTVHQQHDFASNEAAVVDFMAAVSDLIQNLGTADSQPGASGALPCVKGGAEGAAFLGDDSAVPGARAAMLAYAAHLVLLRLSQLGHFKRWAAAWRNLLVAGFSLAQMFGAPEGECLPPWQVASLQPLLLLLGVPAFYSYTQEFEQGPAAGTPARAKALPPVALPQVMRGYVEFVKRLTGPYKAALTERVQEDASSTTSDSDSVGLQLLNSTGGVKVYLKNSLLAGPFIEAGGIAAILGYLSVYAGVQAGLPWAHGAHRIASNCMKALNGLLAVQQLQQPPGTPLAGNKTADELLFEEDGIKVLLAVLASSPSLAEALAHYHEPLPEAGQPRDWEYRWTVVQYTKCLLQQVATTHVMAKVELVLALDGLRVLVRKGTHLEDGLSLGSEEARARAGMTPEDLQVVQTWVLYPMLLIAELVEPALGQDPLLTEMGVELTDRVFKRMRQLMSPGELVGLLAWCRDAPKLPGQQPLYVQGMAAHQALQSSILFFVTVMAQKFPGISKVLAKEAGFVGELIQQCSTPSHDGAPINVDELRRRTWAATLLHDMVTHLGSELAGRLVEEGAVLHTLRLVRHALLAACELDRMMVERLKLLRGKAGKEHRKAYLQQYDEEMPWYCGQAVASITLLESLLVQETPRVRGACAVAKAEREPGGSQLLQDVQRLAAAVQQCCDRDIKAAGERAKSCVRRLTALAVLAAREEAGGEAAAAEAMANALLAEEEQAQQASAARAAKRQRQKAAKQAQQAQAAQERAAQEQRQREERERQLAEERARQQQETEERAAEEAAVALLAEEEAVQRRAAAKAAKRQRQKAARQAQQGQPPQQEGSEGPLAEVEAPLACAAEAAAGSQPSSSGSADQPQSEPLGARPAQPPRSAPYVLHAADGAPQQASSSAPEIARLQQSSSLDRRQQRQQRRWRQQQQQQQHHQQADTAVGGGLTDTDGMEQAAAMEGLAGLPDTPKGAEPRAQARLSGPEAPSLDAEPAVQDDEAEFQALLSLLLPDMQPSPGQPAGPSGLMASPQVSSPSGAPSSSSGGGSGASQAAQEELRMELGEQARATSPGLTAVLVCGLTGRPLRDPVVAFDGRTYEREAMQAWLAAGNVCSPVTGRPLGSVHLRLNFAMRELLGSAALRGQG